MLHCLEECFLFCCRIADCLKHGGIHGRTSQARKNNRKNTVAEAQFESMHEHHKKKIIGINTTEVAEAQFESMLRIGRTSQEIIIEAGNAIEVQA